MDPRETVQAAIDEIEAHLLEEISVRELAGTAGYSYTHFCRLFRKYTGLTPKEYLRRRRLLCAVHKLRGGGTNLEVAMEYGYATYAGFYKAFRREFGLAPSAYLRSYPDAKSYKINLLQEEQIMVSKTRLKELLGRWGRQDQEITNVINENTGRRIENAYCVGPDAILKVTANPAAAEKTAFFGKVIPTRDGEAIVADAALYFVLTERIPGRQLRCAEIFENPALGQTIGEQIAQLHRKLRALDANGYKQADLFGDCAASLDAVKELAGLSDEFMSDYKNAVERFRGKLPVQLIHRDLTPSALIFENGEFRGFSDFELSEKNIRVFDLCYCATAILSECFDDPKIDKSCWKEILEGLIAGYDRIEPLTKEEKEAIPYVIDSIQFLCITYFSSIDKYADLAATNIRMLRLIGETL